VLYLSPPGGVAHLTFVKNEKGKQMIFDLAGRSDRQPNLENYYLEIDTLGIGISGETPAIGSGFEGECHFSMNRTAKIFYFVKCEIYNREKGMRSSFYLENITATHRDIVK
jgi:hypothetical protein